MTRLIIYHQVKQGIDCPDGLVSACIASSFYPEADVLGCCYQELPEIERFKNYQELILVDFSFPTDYTNLLLANGLKVTVIDHHKTAWEDLGNLEHQLFKKVIAPDGDYCGATLAWEKFYGKLIKARPDFLKYVQDRDLFDFKHEDTQAIHEAFSKLRTLCPDLKSKFALIQVLFTLDDQQIKNWLVPIGNSLLKPKMEEINRIASSHTFIEILDYTVPCVLLMPSEERLTSDVCMKLYKQYSEHPFVVAINSDRITFSLRSNKWGQNFDVSELAKKFGGGGHRNASGFKIDNPSRLINRDDCYCLS